MLLARTRNPEPQAALLRISPAPGARTGIEGSEYLRIAFPYGPFVKILEEPPQNHILVTKALYYTRYKLIELRHVTCALQGFLRVNLSDKGYDSMLQKMRYPDTAIKKNVNLVHRDPEANLKLCPSSCFYGLSCKYIFSSVQGRKYVHRTCTLYIHIFHIEKLI